MLDCLAHICFDHETGSPPVPELWERIRSSFACVCLPLRCLRHTAEVWRAQLEAGQEGTYEPRTRAMLAEAAAWVRSAGFAHWPAPVPDGRSLSPHRHLSARMLFHLPFWESRVWVFPSHLCEHVLVVVQVLPFAGRIACPAVPSTGPGVWSL